MTDDQAKPADQAAGNAPSPSDHEEVNWGEDWESAFQAEDDAFFEGKEEDFFLNEKTAATVSGIAAPETTPSPALTVERAARAWTPASLLLTCKAAGGKQFARLQSFPIFIRIPLYCLPLLLAAFLFFLSGTGEKPKPESPQPEKAGDKMPSSSTRTGAIGDLPEASQLQPGKVKKRWPFKAFLIPVAGHTDDQPATFVIVEVTLIASLNEQEEPPAEKKIFVRDIIYQFFQNRPIEDLRRFSLARGEMNRELKAWLQKQWPESPVELIILSQYRLL